MGRNHLPYTYVGLARTIYIRCIRYFWQGIHHTYGHIRCIYTDLANPTHMATTCEQLRKRKHLHDLAAYTLTHTQT